VSSADAAAAYSRAAEAWATGPGRVYDALADVLVGRAPVPLAGRTLLDVGAGRGAATRALARLGAHAVPVDLAKEMIAASRRAAGPPGVVADALVLPIASDAVDGVVAAFSYNHLTQPGVALAEAARVTRPGGVVLASAYATDDDHPVKRAIDDAAAAAGWTPPEWIEAFRRDAVPLLATVERAEAVLAEAGLGHGGAVHLEVPFPDLVAEDLVEWRLGMAQVAPFIAELPPPAQAALRLDALARLGADPPPLVRRIIVLSALI
jgi:SAM-dependent methyltransferase